MNIPQSRGNHNEEEAPYTDGTRPLWVYYPQGLMRRVSLGAENQAVLAPATGYAVHKIQLPRQKAIQGETDAPADEGSLYQESFFFCKIGRLADLPGTGRIYVEIVAHPATGVVFAKVYPSQSALNAADVLASRVLPFFEREGIPIKRIFTRKTKEYCGRAPVHAFETLLATAHIEHVPVTGADASVDSACADAYRELQREFFSPVLRTKFRLSLAALQKELDRFLDRQNAERRAKTEPTVHSH
jgi:hypothetical protein